MTGDRADLIALLDGIVPPRDDLAGAGGLGLADAVLADASASERTGDLEAILDRVPAGFASLDGVAREAALRAIADRAAREFASVVNLAYTAYYTDPRVLHALQARTGYLAGPPQPEGYRLDGFDEAMVQRVRERGPIWRRA